MECFDSQLDTSDDGRPMQVILPIRGVAKIDLGPPEVRHEREREKDRKVRIEPQLGRAKINWN